MGQSDLKSLLERLPETKDPRLVASFGGAEDAAVFRLGDGRLMIQTVDFFTPIVDDPFVFGQVAAANSISDVYAMGATPAVALAVTAFPASVLPLDMLGEIFRGAADKGREAGIEIAGGHSIDSNVPMYGLSVTGFCREDELWRNGGAKDGDEIVLSKGIGTGILTCAYRAERTGKARESEDERFSAADEAALVRSLVALNRYAAEAARSFSVHAATDVTGFGLLGHLHEMAENSGLSAAVEASLVPILPGAARLARAGIAPGGTKKNLLSSNEWLDADDSLSRPDRLLLADAQTNGGLLFAVPAGEGDRLVAALVAAGCPESARIGRFVAGPAGRIRASGTVPVAAESSRA